MQLEVTTEMVAARREGRALRHRHARRRPRLDAAEGRRAAARAGRRQHRRHARRRLHRGRGVGGREAGDRDGQAQHARLHPQRRHRRRLRTRLRRHGAHPRRPDVRGATTSSSTRRMLGAASGERRGIVVSVVDGRERVSTAEQNGALGGRHGRRRPRRRARGGRRSSRNDCVEAPRPKPAMVTLAGGVQVFADVFAEPPEVVIIGGGHVGRAVATVAHTLGYRITVIDDRADFANSERFPEAHKVIAGDIEEAIDEPRRRTATARSSSSRADTSTTTRRCPRPRARRPDTSA